MGAPMRADAGLTARGADLTTFDRLTNRRAAMRDQPLRGLSRVHCTSPAVCPRSPVPPKVVQAVTNVLIPGAAMWGSE